MRLTDQSQVTWARFETSDINDPGLYGEPGLGGGAGLPLLLVLGYTSGVQVSANQSSV